MSDLVKKTVEVMPGPVPVSERPWLLPHQRQALGRILRSAASLDGLRFFRGPTRDSTIVAEDGRVVAVVEEIILTEM